LENQDIAKRFAQLSTALVFDACLRLKVEPRLAPPELRPLFPGSRVAGRILPVHHRGSVDIFLEAMRDSSVGDIMVIDNEGRTDESCIGDLTVLEARAWGLAGMVVRGYHRDTFELREIGFPVFSFGAYPAGPRRLDPRGPDDFHAARWDGFDVGRDDVAFADDDGVVFVGDQEAPRVLDESESIWKKERGQAEWVIKGKKLSEQLDFDGYLERRKSDPGYTFRKHLREIGKAVEE
jgi:4-hydroxy-4-methyl-2-oxoglutarate aldolase